MTKFDGSKIVLSDQELIQYTRNVIINSKKNNSELLYKLINQYESFKVFYETYFSDIIKFDAVEEENHFDII